VEDSIAEWRTDKTGERAHFSAAISLIVTAKPIKGAHPLVSNVSA